MKLNSPLLFGKRIFLFLFLFQISLNAFSQIHTDEIRNILKHIGDNTPADQLFLHLDRNLYHGGDTIRFQAFIRDSQTGIVETQSNSLYVLLVDSKHITVDSARFRVSYAASSGWLKVPENAPNGYYSIVAFTSGQMNYDPRFAFHTTIRIEKLGSRTNNRPQSIEVSTADLRFLPEGGTFIYGVKQRLAFNAVSSTGKIINVSGDIVDKDGKKITEMKSGKYGPGVIEFTPLQGETYYAKPVEKEFGNIMWPLPEPEKTGVSLRVDNHNPGLLDITLRATEVSGRDYFLAVTLNNVLLFSRDIKMDTLFNARIKTAEIPAGTAIVTLYDNELNPVAERLVFLNHERKMKVEIDLSKSGARAGKESELKINTTDEKGKNISSIISVSVIDSSTAYNSGIACADIESSFLYDNEFYNNLPHSIRCIGLRNIDTKSIDVLMMTYGWRKYTLKETVQAYQEKRDDNYDNLKISNPGKQKYGRVELNLLSPEGGEVITLGLNEGRDAVLPFDSLDPGVRQVMVLPDDGPSRNSNPVTFQFPENKAYTDSAKLAVIYSSNAGIEVSSDINKEIVFNPDSAIMIEPVTIKGNRKQSTEFVAASSQQFKYSGAFTIYGKDLVNGQTFEDIIYKLGAYRVDKKTKRVILRPTGNIPRMPSGNSYGDGISSVFVVDNTPIFDRTYLPIAQMQTSEIASITVMRGPQAFAYYGNIAVNGAIIVTTRTGNRINGIFDPNDIEEVDNHLEQVRIFRSEVEFYIPTKEQADLMPEFQSRPTLLWKSDIYLDGSGPVKFTYPNNNVKGTVIISVNGVSFNNLVGSGRHVFSTKQ